MFGSEGFLYHDPKGFITVVNFEKFIFYNTVCKLIRPQRDEEGEGVSETLNRDAEPGGTAMPQQH